MVPERLTTMYNPAVGWDVWQGDPGRGGSAQGERQPHIPYRSVAEPLHSGDQYYNVSRSSFLTLGLLVSR